MELSGRPRRPESVDHWYRHGAGLRNSPSVAGEFSIECQDDKSALTGIYPSGVYSHSVSTKYASRLSSPDLDVGQEMELWVQAIGKHGSTLRYAVEDYPRKGTVYPVKELKDRWSWYRFDLGYWEGDQIHVELATAADAPLLAKEQSRSWFGVREVRLQRKGESSPPPQDEEFSRPLWQAAQSDRPESFDSLCNLLTEVIANAIRDWSAGKVSDAEARLLDVCLQERLLENRVSHLPVAGELIQRYRELEGEIAIAIRVPGLDESVGGDQALYIRGDHRRPSDPVPRRFLEAIDGTPYQTSQSGRMELAEDLLREDNPLTRRVLANRVWHHLFGRGIVSTPDNFGELGDRPSHPELLDWLARNLQQDGWSLKALIRRIVTSRTWQLDSSTSPEAQKVDPDNRLLSHANLRRLEAEAIRDQMLFLSGRLDPTMGGQSVTGASPRRSVYVRVRRNSLDPFLRVFDFPEPFSAVGRRNVTNVPAQSLAILNDSRTVSYARQWTQSVLRRTRDVDGARLDRGRVTTMFEDSFCRSPTDEEITRCLRFVDEFKRKLAQRSRLVDQLRGEMTRNQSAIDLLEAPVRKRLLAKRRDEVQHSLTTVPDPIASWDFAESVRDQSGSAHGQLRGGAKIDDGTLIVRDGGHVVTRPLEQGIDVKTLEAWVWLDDLDQRGGGVMTIQSPDGRVFDSIVFGEKQPGRWLAGSDHHQRSESFAGSIEADATHRWVHVAIVYHSDGRITCYRDGSSLRPRVPGSRADRFSSGTRRCEFWRPAPPGGWKSIALGANRQGQPLQSSVDRRTGRCQCRVSK